MGGSWRGEMAWVAESESCEDEGELRPVQINSSHRSSERRAVTHPPPSSRIPMDTCWMTS